MMPFWPEEKIISLWNAETCPAEFLPHLAWACSVDEWDALWSEEKKRAVIAAAREIHRHKGTPHAMRRALESVGQHDATLIERSEFIRCDGSVSCDGSRRCGGEWATLRIVLEQPLTVSMAYLIKRLIGAVNRHAVHLLSIDYQQSAFRCDGTIVCDGEYTCGTVATTIN